MCCTILYFENLNYVVCSILSYAFEKRREEGEEGKRGEEEEEEEE